MEKKRILYFDILRIFAVSAVIFIHVAAQKWYSVKVGSFEWIVFDVYDSVMRWAVPSFVMISGALFLSRDRGIKYIFKNHFLRMITAFCFWSAVYIGTDIWLGGKYTHDNGITQFIKGHYHLWYIFVIAGIYLLVPLLKKITESEKLTKYLLILSFAFSIVVPTLSSSLSFLNEIWYGRLRMLTSNADMVMLRGYIFYFVLGFYLKNKDFSKIQRRIIYALGILGAACTIALSIHTSLYRNKSMTAFLDNFMLNNFLESLGIFVFFKYNAGKKEISLKKEKIILKLSKYSFGIYLCHPIALEFMQKKLEFTTLSLNPLISVPLIFAITFAVSLTVSALLNCIPIVKKYIV